MSTEFYHWEVFSSRTTFVEGSRQFVVGRDKRREHSRRCRDSPALPVESLFNVADSGKIVIFRTTSAQCEETRPCTTRPMSGRGTP